MSNWPEQPVNVIIKWLKKQSPSFVIADFGCGENILDLIVNYSYYTILIFCLFTANVFMFLMHSRGSTHCQKREEYRLLSWPCLQWSQCNCLWHGKCKFCLSNSCTLYALNLETSFIAVDTSSRICFPCLHVSQLCQKQISFFSPYFGVYFPRVYFLEVQRLLYASVSASILQNWCNGSGFMPVLSIADYGGQPTICHINTTLQTVS